VNDTPSSPLLSDPSDRTQYDLRTLFLLTLVCALCVWFFVVWGWMGIPVAGIFFGSVTWIWANMKSWPVLRRMAAIFTGISLAALLVVTLLFAWVLWMLAAGVVAAMVLAHLRQAEKSHLLWLLATAAERQAPLAPAVWAFSRECGATFRWRVRRLAAMIGQGIALDAALAQNRRALPGQCAVAARVGMETGQLGAALHEVAAARSKFEPLRTAATGRLLYFYLVLCVAGGVGTFYSNNLFRYYRLIFRDFGQPLPSITQWVFFFADEVTPYVWLALPLLFIGLGYLLLLHTGWLPALLDRGVDKAFVLRMLAFCVARDAPLQVAVRAMVELHPRRKVRRRMKRLEQELAAGKDWCDGLRRQRLLSAAEVGVLPAAARAGNLAFALRELAAGAERRNIYRLQAMVQLLSPWIVLAVGLLVFVLVISWFLPLVAIIEGNIPP
jgi:type II secretory pathway component PulF